MKEKIDSIFYELKHELITEKQAHQQILDLFGLSNCPAWLDNEDYELAKMLFAENKLNGVKYLMELARPHVQYPLRWSKDFLEGCC